MKKEILPPAVHLYFPNEDSDFYQLYCEYCLVTRKFKTLLDGQEEMDKHGYEQCDKHFVKCEVKS